MKHIILVILIALLAACATPQPEPVYIEKPLTVEEQARKQEIKQELIRQSGKDFWTDELLENMSDALTRLETINKEIEKLKEYNQAHYECLKEARITAPNIHVETGKKEGGFSSAFSRGYSAVSSGRTTDQVLYDACMRARGFK